jgi:hypothetical protein
VYAGGCTNISHEPKRQATTRLIKKWDEENMNIEHDECPENEAVYYEEEKDMAENGKSV